MGNSVEHLIRFAACIMGKTVAHLIRCGASMLWKSCLRIGLRLLPQCYGKWVAYLI